MELSIPTSTFWRSDEPSSAQWAALSRWHVRELLFGGAAGGGKSELLLLASTQFSDMPDSHSLILRRTFADLQLEDAIMTRAQSLWHEFPWNQVRKTITFPPGSTLSFGYLDGPRDHLRYQGSAYTFIGIDEASQIRENQIRYMHSRLRKPAHVKVPLQMRYASNPGDISHDYLKDNFVDNPIPGKREFIPSLLDDNPYLNKEEYRESLQSLDPVTRAQLLNGDWNIRPDSEFFPLNKLKRIAASEVPTNAMRFRSWDLAGTVPSPSNPNPDYTVGVLVAYVAGQYFILDIERFRKTPAEVEATILRCGHNDGIGTQVIVEQEPGSAGQARVEWFQRSVLPGFMVHAHRPTGPKETRAMNLAAAMNNGNVHIVERCPNTHEMLDEFRGYTQTGHDDIVDALSQMVAFVGVRGGSIWVS